MRNKLKKVLVVVMAFALLFGVVGVPAQSVQAASKLKKTDFKFTVKNKKYRKGMNNIIKYDDVHGWSYYYLGTSGDYEKEKGRIKTKRGIILGDTKKKVFKKYGKVSLKHLNGTFDGKRHLYHSLFTYDSETFDSLSNSKFAGYKYKKNGNTYRLLFFFDDDDRVKCILASANII